MYFKRQLQECLLMGFFQICTIVFAQQHGSFAATKFDLNAALPIEDLTIAGLNRDERPIHVIKENKNETQQAKKEKKKKKEQEEMKKTASATQSTTVNATHQESGENTRAIIPPQNLHSVSAPHAQTMPTTSTETTSHEAAMATSQQSQQTMNQLQQQLLTSQAPLTSEQQTTEQIQSSKPLRADEWFREDFDTSDCSRNGADVAQAFKHKFPRNLLRDGKEMMLAELLATRIRECRNKQEFRHWSQVDEIVAQSKNTSPTEREECIAGLIEEQIACINIISYSCQFIRPTYLFRLLPTRIIVQEARYAEDGAEKCRKFSRKLDFKKPHY